MYVELVSEPAAIRAPLIHSPRVRRYVSHGPDIVESLGHAQFLHALNGARATDTLEIFICLVYQFSRGREVGRHLVSLRSTGVLRHATLVYREHVVEPEGSEGRRDPEEEPYGR